MDNVLGKSNEYMIDTRPLCASYCEKYVLSGLFRFVVSLLVRFNVNRLNTLELIDVAGECRLITLGSSPGNHRIDVSDRLPTVEQCPLDR